MVGGRSPDDKGQDTGRTGAAGPPSEPPVSSAGTGTAGGSALRPLESSIAVERSFRVDGKKVTVQAVLPATLAKDIGMDALLACAQRLIVTCDSKQAKVVAVKLGEG